MNKGEYILCAAIHNPADVDMAGQPLIYCGHRHNNVLWQSKNVSRIHMAKFYNTFDEIKNNRYDGMIITGAPVEQMEFEEVDYWDELCTIMEWSKKNVYSM